MPVAFVVRCKATLDGDRLIALCRTQIAGYKLARKIRFVADTELPRSATGKVKQQELEQRLARKA